MYQSEDPLGGTALTAEKTPYDHSDAYRIMRAKIIHDGFARPHLDSFSDFCNVKIPSCLGEHAPIVVLHEPSDTEHIVEIQGVRYDRPSVREANGTHRYVTPHECHLRRLTYQMNLNITARYMIRQRSSGKILHSVIFRDKKFDSIPVMKLSEFCMSQVDPEAMMEDESECGGYFLSTGAEKVVVGQEAKRTNYVFVSEDSDGTFKCECRSFNETKYRSTSTLYIYLYPPYYTKDLEERQTCVPRVMVRIPFVADPLPLTVTFKLLGVVDIEAMLDYICIADDPAWFRARILDALLFNIDAVVMSHEFVVTRLAHDRGQAYTNTPRKRKGAPEEETMASKRRRKRQEEESEYERCQKQVNGLLSTEFFPHQGFQPEAVGSKTVLFGISVRKLFRVYYGLQEMDDQDHYMHRRVLLTSPLMTLLFRKHFTMWRRRMASQIRRDLENGSQFVNVKQLLQANIGGNLQTALSTGNFSMQRGQNNMDGVGQVLNRKEPNAPESHVNRTTNPMNKDGRAIAPRLQNESCMGIIDPWETSEGQACGLMRNMSPMAGVRIGYPNATLIDAVLSTGMVDVRGAEIPVGLQSNCQVLVSGTLIGTCLPNKTDALLKLLRARRAVQDIPLDVSIYHTTGAWATTHVGEIHINGDGGSYWWPLVRVDRLADLRQVLDHITNEDELWSCLLSDGIVELINKDEEMSNVRVALYHQQLVQSEPGTYTHMVIHPSQICSVFTARGPLLEFDQSPRVTYQASMNKQAVGRGLTNAKFRVDTASHTLWYPAKPLVSTLMDDILNPDGIASVQNPVVCILANGGYNIEDSIIFNQAAVDRGLFRSSVTRTTRDVVRVSDLEREVLEVPPEGCRSRLHANYSHIDPATGVVPPNIIVHGNDVLISKTVHMVNRFKETNARGEEVEVETDTVRDRSTTFKSREEAVVDDVIFSESLEGETTVRVKTRSMRTPMEGDKFCSRHGQKGTIGAVYPAGDMPFNPETGIAPALIINPHAIPSRMTIGHLLENLLGKLAALSGELADGTPFSLSDDIQDCTDHDVLIKRIAAELEKYGFRGDGTEVMCDGRTGRRMNMLVFVGPMSYQKLGHMVKDKYHARSRGPVQMQTGQPVEGRHRDGGQRFGEMERDNLLGHGATNLLHERLLISSDRASVPICAKCGLIAQPSKRNIGHDLFAATIHAPKPFCQACLSHDTVRTMEIPFAYRLATQEIQALHLNSAFAFNKD